MAAIIAAAAEALVVLGAVVGAWVQVNVRLAKLETRLANAEGVLHRIEDAIWAQAGIAALGPRDEARRG